MMQRPFKTFQAWSLWKAILVTIPHEFDNSFTGGVLADKQSPERTLEGSLRKIVLSLFRGSLCFPLNSSCYLKQCLDWYLRIGVVVPRSQICQLSSWTILNVCQSPLNQPGKPAIKLRDDSWQSCVSGKTTTLQKPRKLKHYFEQEQHWVRVLRLCQVWHLVCTCNLSKFS
jgi:hypothetical protein